MAAPEPHGDDGLLDRLIDEHGLREAVVRACDGAGAPERTAEVEYCLAVLARKHDPARAHTYGLDPDAADVRDRLDHWAAIIVRNLQRWGETYEQIRDEADDYTTETIRRLVRITRPEDVVAVVADELSDVLVAGPPLEEMSLERARAREPGGNDYVFQSPLPRWLSTSIRRRLPREDADIKKHEEELWDGKEEDLADAVVAMNDASDEIFGGLVRWIMAISGWKGSVAEALDMAARAEDSLADAELAREHDRELVAQLRASLLSVGAELRVETRSIPGAAAYIVLALRAADLRQRIAILSLRMERVDSVASGLLERGLRAALTDERQPTPELLRRTREAPAETVPRSRVAALEEVRDAGPRRSAVLAPMARRLDELPRKVADLAAIAAHQGATITAVTTHRSAAAKELDAVHWAYGRLFRRYAIGRL